MLNFVSNKILYEASLGWTCLNYHHGLQIKKKIAIDYSLADNVSAKL